MIKVTIFADRNLFFKDRIYFLIDFEIFTDQNRFIIIHCFSNNQIWLIFWLNFFLTKIYFIYWQISMYLLTFDRFIIIFVFSVLKKCWLTFWPFWPKLTSSTDHNIFFNWPILIFLHIHYTYFLSEIYVSNDQNNFLI